MLRRPIDLKQVGASEVEIELCRTELLEEKWREEEALSVVPRFWRGAPCTFDRFHALVARM